MVWLRLDKTVVLFLSHLLLATIIVNTESRIPVKAGAKWTSRCPCRKCDVDDFGRKRVTCDEGNRYDIPTRLMDTSVEVRYPSILSQLIIIIISITHQNIKTFSKTNNYL